MNERPSSSAADLRGSTSAGRARGLAALRHAWLPVAAVALASGLLVGCNGGTAVAHAYTPPTGGDADRGRAAIMHFNCGSCHSIPGVEGASGRVAAPLDFFSARTYVGGELPNTPENLVRWIRDPKSVEPGTAMPTLGVSEQQARDIAAYLYTLK